MTLVTLISFVAVMEKSIQLASNDNLRIIIKRLHTKAYVFEKILTNKYLVKKIIK